MSAADGTREVTVTTWSCVIPGRPRQKGNKKRAFVRAGRAVVVPDKATIEAEANAKGIAWQQRPPELFEGPLVVDVHFCFAIPPSRRKGKRAVRPGDPHAQDPDRGNCLKMAEDILEGIAYANDNAVCDGRVWKTWEETDCTRVTVRAIAKAGPEVQQGAPTEAGVAGDDNTGRAA